MPRSSGSTPSATARATSSGEERTIAVSGTCKWMPPPGGPCPGAVPLPPAPPPAATVGRADGVDGDAAGDADGVTPTPAGTDGVGSGEVEMGGRVGSGTGGVTAGTPAEGIGSDGSAVGDGTPRTASTCRTAGPGVKLPDTEASTETGKQSTMAATGMRSSAGARNAA
jgi:hypothetical protein